MLLAILHLAPLITAPAPALLHAPPAHLQEGSTAQEATRGGGWEALESMASAELGEPGEQAARFLRQHRPERDAELPADLLIENLRLAFEARARFPWAKDVPDELFLNDVLPYAILDEKRESWRPMILELTAPIVADCKTSKEAVQAINRELYDKIKVHYNTGRKRPNACATESIEQGRATCTGLTILLVEACRSVGIPARAAGVFLWHDDRGNHTWPEVWVEGRWQFTGADEYDAKGLNRGWFVADAARATAGDVKHGVWASSWSRGDTTFPLAWAPRDRSVSAVEVTGRYVGDDEKVADALGQLAEADRALGEEASQRLLMELWKERKDALAAELTEEAEAKAYEAAGQTLRIKERVFGEAPDGGHSLWISMHGGGGAPPRVNTQQWQNQIKLYQPKEGIYLAPRAPTDTWNLWHQAHIDPLFARLIENMIALRNVNPDKIYLMGYSAGGDGVWQLAPRMADRFAAASMMAGHPNEAQLLGLRNLPFAIFMGANDSAYDRNKIAAEKTIEIKALQKADPEGYTHMSRVYPGLGHWMNLKDAEALPWMAKFSRDPWPKKIVWLQDNVTHDRFYWLQLPEGTAEKGQKITATVNGQKIQLSGDVPKGTRILLSDQLLDLDQPIEVTVNDQPARKFESARSTKIIREELALRMDIAAAPTAVLVLE